MLEATIAAMRKLAHDEVHNTGRFDHARVRYEMNPVTRAELISELMALSAVIPRLREQLVEGEVRIDHIPVDPNPLLGEDVVRLVVGIRTGEVVRTPDAFTDERKRR